MTEDNSLKSNVVQFNGTWFKLDDFALRHPGGKSFVRIFEGRDVTHAFRSYHPHLSDHHFRNKLQKEKGNGIDTNAKEETILRDVETKEISERHAIAFRELQKKAFSVLGGFEQSKGNFCYFVKALALITIAIARELMQWINGFTMYRAVLLGLLSAMVGLNIAHDSNHGAISVNPKVNYIFGLTMEWFGGSHIHWKHRHNVLHHLYK